MDLRVEKLIKETIQKFKLDLKGMKVLTEAGTGYYSLGPIIAAKAGAKRVFCYAKTSRYASATELKSLLIKTSRDYQVSKQIEVFSHLDRNIIAGADIVTNTGSIRPIDKKFIAAMKKEAVIALMYETWEFRQSDLDLKAAKKREIMVMGTNESACGIFEYVQPLAVKMIFDSGLEILGNNFLIISSDRFGPDIKSMLERQNAKVKIIGAKADFDLKKLCWKRLDAIIVADIRQENALVGKKGVITVEEIKKFYPEARIIQFAGEVEIEKLSEANIKYYPSNHVGSCRMGQTLSDLGPKAVIEYLTAGLKVGEEMRRARGNFLDFTSAKNAVLKNPICQDLS